MKHITLKPKPDAYKARCPECGKPDFFYPTSTAEEKAKTAGGFKNKCFYCKADFLIFIN